LEKLAPVPICPIKLEVQTILELRFPSCESVEAPVNWIGVVLKKVEPLAGLEMVTLGAEFAPLTVILTDRLVLAPAESVTLAVMTCAPALSVAEKLPPVPI
jgi:hypothetical protein